MDCDQIEAEIPTGVRWYGHTDAGRVRKNNEDSFLGLQFDAQEMRYLGKLGESSFTSGDFAFAVSDGMGGAKAGEFASRIAAEKITRLLPPAFLQSAIGMKMGFPDVLGELFEQIHRSLTFLGESDEDCRGMGATLSLCWFRPGKMVFGHVGDSRIYYLSKREGVLRQVTHDDTHVGWLMRTGEINEYQARNHPRRNVLQKALGAGHRYIEPQVGSVICEPGDLFLICSDGVTDGLFDERLCQLLQAPSEMEKQTNPARRIVHQSVEQSGRDNTTALVIEMIAEPIRKREEIDPANPSATL